MADSPLLRHIRACNNITLPAGRLPLRIAGATVGWLDPALAAALQSYPQLCTSDGGGLCLTPTLRTPDQRSCALAAVLPELAARGFFRLRGEDCDLRASSAAPVLARLDRGALPAFGALAQGVHLNGLVRQRGELHIWVAVRARDKAIAPGQLDNIVAGGIPAGLDAWQCLRKEAAEEASLPPDLIARAIRVGRVSYMMLTPEGLRRDILHCFDLELPPSFAPRPADGEVERFELWPAHALLDVLRTTERVKFNVTLVLIDLFLRHGLIDDRQGVLRAGLDQGPR